MSKAKQEEAIEKIGQFEDICVRQKVASLRNDWPGLSSVKRGQRVKEILTPHLSIRALAKELSVAESTLRRDLIIAELPREQQQSIDNGADATPLVKAARRLRRQKRLEEELSDAANREKYISDHVLDIYRFLDKKGKPDSSVRDVILKAASDQLSPFYPGYKPPTVHQDNSDEEFGELLDSCSDLLPKALPAMWDERADFQDISDQITMALQSGVADPNLRDEILRRARQPYDTDRVFIAAKTCPQQR